MKTFKATVIDRDGIDFIDVPATEVELHPKFRTFVHRDTRRYNPKQKNPMSFKNWSVSEQVSGATITTGVTRKDAIAKAKGKIDEVGIDGMNIAIASFVNTHGIKFAN